MSRPTLSGSSRSAVLLGNDGDGSTLTLDFTTGVLDPRLTFTRASGGTYTGNDGLVYGMDFATSGSLSIGTGSRSVTLTATAGVDRRYLVGQTVYISNGANNMSGPVTAYNASTQVLTINATATSGSGSFTSWSVGNASARFDYDPTTLAPKGLLIEGTATSLSRSSQNLTDATYWTLQTAYASTSATGGTAPDGTNTGSLFTEPSSNLQRSIYQSYSSAAGTYTFSVWLKAGSGSTRYMRLVVSSGASDFGYVTINMSTGAIQQAATVVGTATNASATVSGNYTATGWRRYSLTVTLAASVNFAFLVPIDLASIDTPTTNYGRVSYLGDGSSFLIWGAQLEAGSGASSYIPTGASTAFRNQDQMQMTNLASLGFNTSAGTMTINGTYNKDANAFPRSIRFMGSSVQSMAMITAGKTLYGNAPNTSGGTYLDVFRTLSSFGAFKYGFTLTTATSPATALAVVSLNGSSATITPLGQGDIVNPISLDFLYPSASALNFPSMNISSVKYWPYAMTSAQLNAMTT
jgi:hypothetical protein